MAIIETKICKTCGKEKSLNDFYKHSEMADGYLNVCKKCKQEYQASRPKEKLKEIEQRRNQKPERRQHLKENHKKWRRENPEKARAQRIRSYEKYKARTALGNAIYHGKIQKEPCKECGNTEVEGHHSDYSKPLNVIWLCSQCHRKYHPEIWE